MASSAAASAAFAARFFEREPPGPIDEERLTEEAARLAGSEEPSATIDPRSPLLRLLTVAGADEGESRAGESLTVGKVSRVGVVAGWAAGETRVLSRECKVSVMAARPSPMPVPSSVDVIEETDPRVSEPRAREAGLTVTADEMDPERDGEKRRIFGVSPSDEDGRSATVVGGCGARLEVGRLADRYAASDGKGLFVSPGTDALRCSAPSESDGEGGRGSALRFDAVRSSCGLDWLASEGLPPKELGLGVVLVPAAPSTPSTPSRHLRSSRRRRSSSVRLLGRRARSGCCGTANPPSAPLPSILTELRLRLLRRREPLPAELRLCADSSELFESSRSIAVEDESVGEPGR